MSRQITPDNWDQGGEPARSVYLHPEAVFPAAVVRRGGDTRPLPVRLRPELGKFMLGGDRSPDQTLAEFLATSPLDGFLIVHEGAIVFEEYPRMQADNRHLIFSVTKAFVGSRPRPPRR